MKFPVGKIVVTDGIADRITKDFYFSEFVYVSLSRHKRCDWGDCCTEDKALNDEALIDGDRLFSLYIFKDETKIWIITEPDRSYTTILFPEEY